MINIHIQVSFSLSCNMHAVGFADRIVHISKSGLDFKCKAWAKANLFCSRVKQNKQTKKCVVASEDLATWPVSDRAITSDITGPHDLPHTKLWRCASIRKLDSHNEPEKKGRDSQSQPPCYSTAIDCALVYGSNAITSQQQNHRGWWRLHGARQSLAYIINQKAYRSTT